MSKPYRFADLVQHSGLSGNEAKHLVQQKVIRPDLKRSKGSGHYATFGFLDVFEAGLVQRFYRLPGGMPIAAVANALYSLRVVTEVDSWLAPSGTAWAHFLDPATRVSSEEGFYLCWSGGVVKVLGGGAVPSWLADCRDAVVTIRLDTWLLELETATSDHTTAAECARAWAPRRRKVAASTAVADQRPAAEVSQ